VSSRPSFAREGRDTGHPDCVEVTWRFNRWHHKVDYSRFANNPLPLKSGVTPTREVDDYGLQLIHDEAAS
jgi:hypothetical protein